MHRMRSFVLIASIGAGSLAVSSAQAGIVFCNEFPHAVYIAIAYPQDTGVWLSRGWLEVPTGECRPFDTALQVKSFYWRGESEEYHLGGKNVTMSWGDTGDRSFAIWEDANFQYYEAEHEVLNSTLKGFQKGTDGADEFDVTVTINADGTPIEVSGKNAD